MADITYCICSDCPLKKCERHLSNAQTQKVKVTDFSGFCTEYIDQLIYGTTIKDKKGENNV